MFKERTACFRQIVIQYKYIQYYDQTKRIIRVKEEKREAVLVAAKELVTASQKDKGCIAYDVFESATRHDVLMICETWKDAEALSAHEHTPHFMTLVPQIEELAEMKIEKFEF